jgi:hypothetical protein
MSHLDLDTFSKSTAISSTEDSVVLAIFKDIVIAITQSRGVGAALMWRLSTLARLVDSAVPSLVAANLSG